MSKRQVELRRRYLPTEDELLAGGPLAVAAAYGPMAKAHRADGSFPEPAHVDFEVVETVAIQNGEKVKIRVAKDQAPVYERIVAALDRAQEEVTA